MTDGLNCETIVHWTDMVMMNGRYEPEVVEEYRELKKQLKLTSNKMLKTLIHEHYQLLKIKNKRPDIVKQILT